MQTSLTMSEMSTCIGTCWQMITIIMSTTRSTRLRITITTRSTITSLTIITPCTTTMMTTITRRCGTRRSTRHTPATILMAMMSTMRRSIVAMTSLTMIQITTTPMMRIDTITMRVAITMDQVISGDRSVRFLPESSLIMSMLDRKSMSTSLVNTDQSDTMSKS